MIDLEGNFPLKVNPKDWTTPKGKLTVEQAQNLGFLLYDLIIDHLVPEESLHPPSEILPLGYDRPLRWSLQGVPLGSYFLDKDYTIINKWLNSASRQTARAATPFLKYRASKEQSSFIQEHIDAAQQVTRLGIDAILKEHRAVLTIARLLGYPTTLRKALFDK